MQAKPSHKNLKKGFNPPVVKPSKKKNRKHQAASFPPPVISPQSPSSVPLQSSVNGNSSTENQLSDLLYSTIAASAAQHHHQQHAHHKTPTALQLSTKAKRKLKRQQQAPQPLSTNSSNSSSSTSPVTPTTTIVKKALTNIAQFATAAISTAPSNQPPPSSKLQHHHQHQQQKLKNVVAPTTTTTANGVHTPKAFATNNQTQTQIQHPASYHKSIASNLTGPDLNQYVTQNLDKYELRIGQFNTLNLVKENEPFYSGEHYSPQKVSRKVDWISCQLTKMNCGIVGFQEVWHRETLLRCTRTSGLYRDEHVYTIDDSNNVVVNFGQNNGASSGPSGPSGASGGPKVALATIYPVLEIEAISDFPQSSLLQFSDNNNNNSTSNGSGSGSGNGSTMSSNTGCDFVVPVKKFSRSVLRAVVELPYGRIVTVFVVHAKSKRPLVSDALRHDQKSKAIGHAMSLVIRAAESTALRHLLVNEMETMRRPVIVIGDLNDNVHSVTTEIITGTVPWKRMSYTEKQRIWDVLLWSTNDVQVRRSDRDVNYSHIHNGRYEVLDHILVSQHFVRTYQNHFGCIMYQQLFNDHLIDETLKDEKRTNIESDHAQVVAVIKLESDLTIQRRKLRMVAEEM